MNRVSLVPFMVGVLAVALMSVGAALIYPPAGLIVAGAALFVDLQLDHRGRPE